MWDAIRSNRRRSAVLLGAMGILLVALGTLIGLYMDPEAGAPVGAVVALVFFLVLMGVALLGGDDVLLMSADAREVKKEDAPQLWNVVEEMTIASGLGAVPRVFVVESDAPNAFAVGLRRGKAAVAVTSGLLKSLGRDELQGVIGHEIGHIVNEDVRFMTIAAVLLGGITLLSDFFFRYLWYGGGRRRGGRLPAQAQIVIVAGAILVAALAPLAARLLYFACARRREFLADACSARFTRYPEGLASGLQKIEGAASAAAKAPRALGALCTVNPERSAVGTSVFSTHPPTEVRVRILRGMAGAGYAEYEEAFRKVAGRPSGLLAPAVLRGAERVAARAPSPEEKPEENAVTRAKEVAAVLGRLANLLPIPCACGLTLKIPQEFESGSVRCPRCGREHAVPKAEGPAPTPKPAAPLAYRRQGAGWESFRCTCGAVQQIGPAFSASHLRCRACGRRIEILAVPDGRPPAARL